MALKRTAVILVAEDDEDDRFTIGRALKKNRLTNTVRFVKDGVELMEYLRRKGHFADKDEYPYPDIILLDLNMPRKNGLEALEEIRADERFKKIPVVVLTTSKSEEDIIRSYDIGANSYIRKPVELNDFIHALSTFEDYWFEVVLLPSEKRITAE